MNARELSNYLSDWADPEAEVIIKVDHHTFVILDVIERFQDDRTAILVIEEGK